MLLLHDGLRLHRLVMRSCGKLFFNEILSHLVLFNGWILFECASLKEPQSDIFRLNCRFYTIADLFNRGISLDPNLEKLMLCSLHVHVIHLYLHLNRVVSVALSELQRFIPLARTDLK